MKRCAKSVSAGCVFIVGLPILLFAAPGQKKQDSERPTLPYQMLGLHQEDIDSYDSKAEPVAAATAATLTANRAGWQLVRKYFPDLGINAVEREWAAHPQDNEDRRFLAQYANEGPGFSPVPLLSMIWSLPSEKLSDGLKSLQEEVATASTLEDYSTWKLDELRKHVSDWTEPATTLKGVKYRRPKPRLTFAQALRLQAMTLALLRAETKWAKKADSPAPDMADFTNRMRHEMLVQISDGSSAVFFLYMPGALEQPLAKGDFAERADTVIVKRSGMSFDVEQFPVFLTADAREWNPVWITPEDEANDVTLVARKFEHDWTRLDGPYVWYRPDLLIGEDVYRSTVKFEADKLVIEAERYIQRRGAAKRVPRPVDYDLSKTAAFVPEKEDAATPFNPYVVGPASSMNQLNELRLPTRYFSNSFRAWCSYGRWDSGVAGDGRTYISVAAEEPREGAPRAIAIPVTNMSQSTARAPQ
jgi:hypothetical protein